MTGYSIIYMILSAILLAYTVRHRVDLLSVAAACYIVYSIYCIPGIGISGYYRPKLSLSLYCSVYLQLLLITAFTFYIRSKLRFREKYVNSDDNRRESPSKEKMLNLSFRIYTAVIAVFALVNIVPVGMDGFASGKSNVWDQTNIFYIISLYGAYPSFAYGIHKRDKWIWVPSLLIELTIFFAGSRAFTATMIIIFLCEKAANLWKRGKGNFRIYVLGAAGIVFLLLYRMVDQFIMAGDMSGTINMLKNPMTWITALEFNEPRVIIANYDYVFTSGIRLPFWDILYRIVDFIPGLNGIFGIEPSYPEYFSTWLMDQVHGSAGVGGTIWGECYAMFGYFGIVMFTLIWLMFIYNANRHLDYHEEYSYFIVSLGTYLAWYINRLDFNRVGQACKIMLFCFLIWAFIFLILGGTIKTGTLNYRLKHEAFVKAAPDGGELFEQE